MARFQIEQQFRVIFSQRFPLDRLTIADFNRSRRVIIGHFTIFYKDTRNTIGCCSHYIRIIKTFTLVFHGHE